MVPVVLVLSSRGCARREKKRKREKERRVETDERACSRFRVTPKSFSSRYDSLLYALDGPPSVSCSQMLVEESEIDTTRCAHALLPWRALMHCQGRIDPLRPTANIFRQRTPRDRQHPAGIPVHCFPAFPRDSLPTRAFSIFEIDLSMPLQSHLLNLIKEFEEKSVASICLFIFFV